MKWIKRDNCNTIAEVVSRNTGLSIQDFLNPKKDPYISNLKEAAEFIRKAAQSGKNIHIVGDYDVDGDLSSSILKMGFTEAFGKEPSVRLPRRFSEGYGLKQKIVDEINDGIIVTVDNGIAALEPIKSAKTKGLDIVIIDHHQPVKNENGEVLLPDADVIVDPHAIPGSEFCGYCGAGLAYRLIKELIPNSPMLVRYLVFASIATVADVMDLVGDNRTLVKNGLACIRKRYTTLGLNTLLNLLDLTYIDEGDYGFKLGPIINASGRLYDDGPSDVVSLMTTHVMPEEDGYREALFATAEKAQILIQRNEERKKLSKEAEKRADKIIEENHLSNTKPLILYDPLTSEGIIGIVAGQLAEKYCTPALVFTDSEKEGILKGSGRTYGTVDLKATLDTAGDLFVGYGGHPGAAGMTIKKDTISTLQKRLAKTLEGVDFGVDPEALYYDLEIEMKDIPNMIKELKLYAPYGQGNPAPIFKIKDFNCTPVGASFYRLMGDIEQHIKLFGKDVDAVGFDMAQRYHDAGDPQKLNIVGTLGRNFFNGTFRNQIEIIDYQPIVPPATDFKQKLADMLVFC